MEKFLKLFTYVDGRNDTPFPNEQEQVVVSEFRGDYKRMGATPTISCTVMHHKCLDKLWTDNVYATFNGEKFFIKQTASSSYDNTDSRYKHEVELVSERIILDNVYFYDVVQSDATNDKPVSNSSNVVFFGDIHEFANRLNYSLQYSKVGYSVVVDDGISSEGKMMAFQNQFFSNVLQEIYNTYEIPYYFVGKVIHIGYTNNAITHTFKYGVDESLLSIQKQNANYKLVNRVTGVGSADNIPYYYPNDYESKEEVEAHGGKWINPQTNLMPSIYRETLGEERFYKALNDTYVSPQTGEYYYFENPFVEGKPKEHIVNFDEIKPSIKGMLNASNQRMDMFVDFAYDAEDNDETDEEGNYLHPYFFAKLRKFDGDYGFNLFEHAIDEQEMVISMTSGSCGACEWIIGVDEESQKNTVQVNSSGNLLRDDKGNIKFGTPQDRQNDTRNYEVWIALKKDINTFGVIMPNASSNYKPSVNDTFVILHIDLPKAYILSAENNLKEQLIKYMAMNNSERFTFSISFSRIFFAENPQILAQLNENARIQIEYDNTNYELYVSSYSYNMSNGSPLPEIKVELSDTLSVQQNALQNAISEVKQDIMSSVGSGDFLQQGLRYFLRKDTSDRTRGKLSSDVGFEVGKYVSGASGAIIYKDSSTGQTIGEVDKLYVRMKAYFETLVISEVNTISGKQIISPAGSIKCIGVDELENAYRCYFLGEQDGSETSNLFHVNDQAYSQTFNAKQGVNNKISNTYYWRLITNVSSDLVVYKNQKCHYIDLSKTDCDNGSDIPKEGDIINHRGSRTDIDRMNFIESSSVDAFSPNITLFHGVNSYSLDGKDYVSYGVDKTTNKAYMNVYGDMFVGDRNGSTYMRYTPEEGLVIKGKLDIETKLGDATLKDLISASTPEGYQEFVEKVTQDIEGLQQQIDGAIESYFYQYEPTLSNYPASSWSTQELKDAHLNDTFTNLVDGRSWRWTIENGNYKWTEITDTATTQALALAGQAQDTADGKRRVFVAQPKPPYDKGDLWSRGKDYPLLLCINAKGANGSYDESDWDYADNTEKLQKELEELVNDTKDELNNAIGQATEAANTYTDNAKSALQTSINELNNAKASVNDVYTKAQADGLISKAEEDAINAAKQQADAAIALSETIVKAYADGIVDAEEDARIKQARENLNTAKEYAERTAQEALNSALSSLSTFNYLKAALKEDTSIEGGLIQSSLIKLGYTSSNTFKVMSGSNGIYNSSLNGGGIASWWGGDTYDLLDYYNWDGTQWVVKKGVTVPSNIPSGLIRFDGTGYFAKGKFWWDNNGEIHADPTALLLSFDVATGDETLASTIINIRKDLASFMDMWEVKKLSDGTEYLYSKRHLATNGGVTMYALDEVTVDSIIDSLPLASTSQYGIAKFNPSNFVINKDGFVTIIGGSGGLDTEELAEYLATNKYVTQGWVEGKGYITSSALNGYATQSWVTNQKYITGITSAMVVSALGFTPYNSANFTKSNIKSTLGISDWALASTKPSYNFSEIGTKPTTIAGYGITDAYTITQADALYAKYLPLIGGTLSGNLVLKSSTTSGATPKLYFQRGTVSDSYYDSYAYNSGGYFIIGLAYNGGPGDIVKFGDIHMLPTKGNSYAIGSSGLRFSNVYSVLGNYSGEVSMQSANINGGKITYDATNKYFKLEGDLLVTGGVSMYSDDSEFTPSTIMDALLYDENTLGINDNGELYVKGGNGGSTTKYPLTWSGFNQGSYDGSVAQSFYIPTKLSEFVNDKSFATTSDLSGYLSTSGGTINGSLVISNASLDTLLTINRNGGSGSSVIQYTNSNNGVLGSIGVAGEWSQSNYFHPIFLDKNKNEYRIYHSGNLTPTEILTQLKTVDGSGSGLDADLLDGYDSSKFIRCFHTKKDINTPINGNNAPFILRTGSINDNPHAPHAYANLLHVSNTNSDTAFELLGAYGVDRLLFRRGTWYADGSGTIFTNPWKIIAFTDSNVASATKLQTPRTIWGQSFDGSANVSGDLTINNGKLIFADNTYIAYGNHYLPSSDGTNSWNVYDSNKATLLKVKSNGNVLIGTTTDSGYKLDVNGSFACGGVMRIERSGAASTYLDISINDVRAAYNAYDPDGFAHHIFYSNGTTRLVINGNTGNVGIGITDTNPAYKLYINGDIRASKRVKLFSEDGLFDGQMYISNGNLKFESSQIGVKLNDICLNPHGGKSQGHVTINGIPIYKSQDDVLYIDGNLVVRGGVTMYAENEVDIPSIIDSLPIANANTQDKASKGIASFDSAYFKVTDGWVTLTSAPSSISTIGSLQDVSPSVSGTTNSDVVLFKSANSSTWTTKPLSEIGGGSSVSGNYLPLSGGTITSSAITPLLVKSTHSAKAVTIRLANIDRTVADFGHASEDGVYIQDFISGNYIGVKTDGTPYFWNGSYKTIIHSDNYSSYALPLSGGTCRWINIDFTSSLDAENSVFIIKRKDRGRFIEFQGAVDYFKGVYNFTHASTNVDIHVFNKGTSYISALQTGSSLPNMDISGCSFTIGDWQGSKFYFDTSNIRLGIGTPKPSAALHVNGALKTNNIGLIEQGDGLYRLAFIGMNSTYGLYIEAGTNADSWQGTLLPMFFGWRGGTAGMVLNGNQSLLVYGGITMYSDIRKKTKLQDVELSLSQIANAPLIQHYYNSDQNKTTHVGSIAQYWAGMNDWFCKLDNEGFYTMEIQNCALASAISIARELVKYESKTDRTIRKMKQRIQELEDKLEKLEGGNYGNRF